MRDRLLAAFVAPAEQTEPARGRWIEPASPAPAAVAVLAPPDRAVAAGAAVALGLTRGSVVVALWGASARGPRAPAWPRAGRLASKLTARGHDAVTSGRLVLVTLGAGADEAARVAAAGDVPVVLVVAGARDAHVDRILRDHDQVLVVARQDDALAGSAGDPRHDPPCPDGGDLVATLALASVHALGVPAQALALADVATARMLAAAGVALVAPWRGIVSEALA